MKIFTTVDGLVRWTVYCVIATFKCSCDSYRNNIHYLNNKDMFIFYIWFLVTVKIK